MRNQFEKQLGQLNNELIEMGSLVEQAIAMAINAFVKHDIEKAQQAVAFDDEINKQEKEIESICLRLLLQQQPVAKDLRLISAALKMITDMERIGDHAADISEITIYMAETPYVRKLEHLQNMAKETTVMLVNSIDAFVNKDVDLANRVIAQDDIVDELFLKIKSDLISMIKETPENGELAIDILMIGKYFEKIGDHAANIAEWVIFSITGKHKA